MKTSKLEKTIRKEVDIRLEVMQEDISVRGNAMASGDDAVDTAAENDIIADLENGNTWAWAQVRVTATWNGLTGSDNLGGCSYYNEADFRNSGYYADMVSTAIAEVLAQAKTIVRAGR